MFLNQVYNLRLRVVVIFVLAFFSAHPSYASALPDCSRTYTLAYHDHGMLYSTTLDAGIDRDVAIEMVKRSGCNVEISVMPRARIWTWIESGQLDFSMSGITNASRDKFADFGWYLYNKYYFLVRKDANIDSLAEFENNPKLEIGAIRSFRYSENANKLVDRLASQHRVTDVPDHAQLLSMLKLNRIQGMIIEPFNYTQVDSRELNEVTKIIDTGDQPVLHGLIMSKKSLSEEERTKWRNIIDGMRMDGTLLKIMSKYFDKEMAISMVDF
ncbi:MAG: transporter substrate-binding domain-containing protein [Gammaproteobacteria bacterium]|nr:transporter substrate-binding domain-containing protein [Gammaproteobacteria bacterium]